MRVIYARQIHLDDHTDIRQEIGAVYEDDLMELTAAVNNGHAILTPGLIGWGLATHTLIIPDEDSAYHVAIENDEA